MLRIVTGVAWTKDKTAESISALEFDTLGARHGVSSPTTAGIEEDSVSMDHKSVQEV